MTTNEDQMVQIALRVPESFLQRMAKLAEQLSQPGMPVTRTEAIRLAAFRGADQLEKEQRKR